MQPTNYCRDILRQFRTPALNRRLLKHSPWLDVKTLADLSDAIGSTIKFRAEAFSPEGYPDLWLRGLTNGVPLRLPYPRIALEYRCENPFAAGRGGSSREVLLAGEFPDRPEWIYFRSVAWVDDAQLWLPLLAGRVHRTEWRDPVEPGHKQARFQWQSIDVVKQDAADSGGFDPADAMSRGVGSLLRFLNTLACSNVRVDKLPVPKVRKAIRRRGDCLPFDEYHVLTVDSRYAERGPGHGGSHRSPREHLRRGHIRHYASGKCIWINATLIAAGAPGRVTKDYIVSQPTGATQ